MKLLKILLSIAIVFLLFGCEEQYATKKVSFKDNLIEFFIPDSDMVVYELKDFREDNVHISVAAIDYSELKHYESESYSTAAMEIFYNSDNNKFEQLLNYLREFDFSTNEFAIFSDYNGYGSTSRKVCVNTSHKSITKDGEIVGEQIFYMPQRKFPFSVSYDFIIAAQSKLIDISFYINVLGNDIQPYTDFIIEKDGSYRWKSEKTKEDFYNILESKKYKVLPKNLQLLRETKDLFLKTFVIND